MPVLGVTGGIATGKSTFTRLLLGRLTAEAFDADCAAHSLLREDREIRSAVESEFGLEVYSASGEPDRARLRTLIFSDERKRKRLEEILHPAIRARWMTLADHARRDATWLIVDLPLLYETGAETQFDRVAVVACARPTQWRRLACERGLDAEMSEKIVAAQFDLQTKITKAEHLIWNDSTLASLEAQTELLANWLKHIYG